MHAALDEVGLGVDLPELLDLLELFAISGATCLVEPGELAQILRGRIEHADDLRVEAEVEAGPQRVLQ